MKSDIVYYDSLVNTINLLNENLYKLRLLILLSDASDKDQLLDILEEIGKIEFKSNLWFLRGFRQFNDWVGIVYHFSP